MNSLKVLMYLVQFVTGDLPDAKSLALSMRMRSASRVSSKKNALKIELVKSVEPNSMKHKLCKT